MQIIEIEKLPNGAHRNQTCDFVPEGYAMIPADLPTPNFPFGDIEVTDGVVTKWTPLPIPEPEPPAPPEPTQLDRIESQATYTALITGTLIGGAKA